MDIHVADTELKRNVKQTIVVRKDCGFSKWDFVHYGILSSLDALISLGKTISAKEEYICEQNAFCIPKLGDVADFIDGRRNITLVECPGLEDIFSIRESVQGVSNIPWAIITDNGLTEFNGTPTITSISVGPHKQDFIAELGCEIKRQNGETCSQVVTLRKDINMRKGKMVAQAAHASMAAILNTGRVAEKGSIICSEHDIFVIEMDEITEAWLSGNFRKIALGCQMSDFAILEEKAKKFGLPYAIARTDTGEPAAIAIGPSTNAFIDPITSELKLI